LQLFDYQAVVMSSFREGRILHAFANRNHRKVPEYVVIR
jgi:hypothetical protein